MRNKNKGKTVIFFAVAFGIAILLAALLTAVFLWRSEPTLALDGFAQCLTDKGYVMYGAYWCSHCQNEKKGFGQSAWKHINYIECAQEPKQCTDAGIKGYPTWIAPDGVRLEGEQGIERLSEASGCFLPKSASEQESIKENAYGNK